MPPDVVYIHKHGVNGSAELRYSLRSLAHLPHGRVWVAGDKPPWCVGVGHIEHRNLLSTKQLNQVRNITLTVNHPGVAEDFVFMNDDFFILKPVEEMPVLHRGPVEPNIHAIGLKTQVGVYRQGLADTCRVLMEWGLTDLLSYELHMPLPMRKTVLAAALAKAGKVPLLQFRSLYGNYARIGGRKVVDVKAGPDRPFNKKWRFVSTSDKGFSVGPVGEAIRDMFPKKSPYER